MTDAMNLVGRHARLRSASQRIIKIWGDGTGPGDFSPNCRAALQALTAALEEPTPERVASSQLHSSCTEPCAVCDSIAIVNEVDEESPR